MDGDGEVFLMNGKTLSFFLRKEDWDAVIANTVKEAMKEAMANGAVEFHGLKIYKSEMVPSGWVWWVDKDGNVVGKTKVKRDEQQDADQPLSEAGKSKNPLRHDGSRGDGAPAREILRRDDGRISQSGDGDGLPASPSGV